MKTLIIIPAYNEALNLPGVIEDIRMHCPWADIVAVNDCSFDNTMDILETLDIPFLNLPVNLGIGGAVQSGFKYAVENGYDIAVQFDGDGQHDASFIYPLTTLVTSEKADMVVGSRFIENQGFQSSLMRRFGIVFLSHLIKKLCGADIKDVTSGMRAFSRPLFTHFADSYVQDYPEPEAVLCAGLLGARIVETPVIMKARRNGESSIGSFGSAYYMIKVTLSLIFTKLFKAGSETLSEH